MITRLLRFAMITVLCALFGCEDMTPAPRVPRSGDAKHEKEKEYQEGLAKILEDAPTAYASDVMTRHYNLGYSVGRLEGIEHRQRENGDSASMGCIGVAPFLLEFTKENSPSLAQCDALKRNDLKEATFGGPRFTEGRLLVARKGAETSDQRITKMLLVSYESGYAMGFRRSSDEGDPLNEMRTAVTYGCGKHVQSYPGANAVLDRCK